METTVTDSYTTAAYTTAYSAAYTDAYTDDTAVTVAASAVTVSSDVCEETYHKINNTVERLTEINVAQLIFLISDYFS
jgi:hypothetical protein